MSVPVFAIVGHPNKGKSSIVSTLAQDESVAISPIPGTTIEDRRYPMVVDGETLYILIDTPGFQRARSALEWMENQPGASLDRPGIVRRFVDEHHRDSRFASECSLLAPILEGAGILYVVDGSRPFGQEYEAEMEILRWTGQPSLALINMIGDSDHSADWKAALGQYFGIVRVFNAMTADFDKRIQLLLAFGQIREEWREPLQKAVGLLEEEQGRRRKLSARLIAESINRMLTLTLSRRLPEGESEQDIREHLQRDYRKKLVAMEQRCRTDIEEVYNHRGLERHESVVKLLEEDLFSRQVWRLFGLTRRQLLATGAVGGAAAGGVIDIAVGGSSLLLGAGVGALIGSVSAWMGSERVGEMRVMGESLGGRELTVGPMRSINFPYVVLGRALLHHRMIEQRTHAHRDPLELTRAEGSLQGLDDASRKSLEKIFVQMRKQESMKPDLLDALAEQIEAVMRNRDVNLS